MPENTKSGSPTSRFPPSQRAAPSALARLLNELVQSEGFSPSLLPGVRFMRSTRHVPRSPIAYQPGIFIVAQGRKVGHSGRRTILYDPAHYLVLSVPLPFECETHGSAAEPLLGIAIGVTPAQVAELVLEMDSNAPTVPPRAIDSAVVDDALREAATRLLQTLSSEEETRVLGALRVRELVYCVLRGPLGGHLQALAAPRSHWGRIGRVLHRLHVNFSRPPDLAGLAREAGMSRSTFHEHFKAATGTSPIQYLKAIRLHQARTLMVRDGLNVGAAARQVGYESISQFSREFKRLFGTSPSATVGRLREMLVGLA